MASERKSDFQRGFHALASRVHLRRTLTRALSGAAFGLVFGAAGALAMWALRFGHERPFALGLGVLGAAIGGYVGTRRRWSDQDVALYLDARLGSHETVTTALHAETDGASEPALSHVVERAANVLEKADRAQVKPRVWSRIHALVPLGAAAIVGISLAPLPKAPPVVAAPPGIERVKIEHLKGLEQIEALEHLRGQTPEQDARLKALAEQAKKLRADLAKGLEKREALSEIAKLRDGIAAERLKLGDQQNRPGLDAALRSFNKNPSLRDAQKALGNGDLTAFDDEMQKLANRAETSDREAAKEALEEAAKAARDKGAKGLGEALESERRLFDKREAHAEVLREFAKGLKNKLSPEAQQDLKDFGSSGDPKAEQRLSEALEKALEGLTPEERKRLQERMQKQLEDADGDATPLSKKQLAEMAKKLSSEDGVEELKKQLKEMAQPDPSDDSKREQGLGEADRGGSAAERGLGAVPIPMDGEGSPGSGANPGGKGDNSDGSGGPGSHHDTGTGDHAGSTPEVAGKELRAKADPRILPGAPMHGATLGRAPARAGETANELGAGSLGSAQQTEVGAVDHSDIPEEYREQVGRYFEP
ncbi:MAG TPA: hypothetical protein VGM44_16970 [Polyangiaceae bacterium]